MSDITFSTPKVPELLVLKDNGDIYVKGKLIENDMDIVHALREFLLSVIVNKQEAVIQTPVAEPKKEEPLLTGTYGKSEERKKEKADDDIH